MAIDYGSRRIGVAISDSGVLATPHSVVLNQGDVVERLAGLARQLDAHTIVVGLPRRQFRQAGDQKFRDFAEQLRQKTSKEVVLWDEALTTVEAAEQLEKSGKSRREAERDIDMIAAAIILQSYLDQQRRQS